VLVALFRPRLRDHAHRSLALAALFGAVLFGMNVCFYHAIARIPLGVAVTVEFVGPLGVALIGSRRRLDLAWVALAAIGIVALVPASGHGLSLLGVVFALLAGCMWGAYILLNARIGREFSDTSGLALAMVVAALLSLPGGVAQGSGRLLVAVVLAKGFAVGVLSSALPYSLELEALRRIATGVFGVLMSLEPAVAALVGWLVIGQSLSLRQTGGIALVVFACLGTFGRARAAPIDA
jgi:inner membrane transporter RhtA